MAGPDSYSDADNPRCRQPELRIRRSHPTVLSAPPGDGEAACQTPPVPLSATPPVEGIARPPKSSAPARLHRANWPATAQPAPPPGWSAEEEPPTAGPFGDFTLARLAKNSPPWLVSAIVHMLLLIVLGLCVLSGTIDPSLVLQISAHDGPGKNLDEPFFHLTPDLVEETPDEHFVADVLPEVEDPFAAPLRQPMATTGQQLTSILHAPAIGLAFSGREEGMKRALLQAYGGTEETEKAVAMGLDWLSRQQLKNGLWSLSRPYAGGAQSENQVAATAMALLAFQGAGYTHKGASTGTYQKHVSRGLAALLKFQDRNGRFSKRGLPHNHALYSHAQATISLCELYGMTQDEQLREPAQKAVDYCVRIQSPSGGWRYVPYQESDTSVTGWFVMALASARMAYLNVPDAAFERASEYLDKASAEGGSRYLYRPSEPYYPDSDRSLAMTAEGLLCRQLMGWPRSHAKLQEGAEYLLRYRMNWDERNVYYWYYATQVCHHLEGIPWQEWNDRMRRLLPEKQVQTGRERGSWDPEGDRWGPNAGRLYVTCLSIYCLEVYYRHLPIYRQTPLVHLQGADGRDPD